MFWWILLAVLTALAILPLGVSVVYDEDGPLVRVIAGFIRLKIFPARKKKKKPKKEKKSKSQPQKPSGEPEKPVSQAQQAPENPTAEAQQAPTQPENPLAEGQAPEQPGPGQETPAPRQPKLVPEAPQEKSGGSVLDFLPLVKVGLDFLGDFFGRKLRVNNLVLKITLAGGDPCDLALNYGRAWAALGNLWPRLERMLVIKKRDVNIQCDFEGEKTTILARLDITITLGRLLGLAVRYAFRALVTFLKIRKKRKGGATA